LFTKDDPIVLLPKGYTIVDMDSNPFTFDRTAKPEIDLIEGEGAQQEDFSNLSYTKAFDAMIEMFRKKYAYTEFKHIDWDAKKAEFAPRIADAEKNNDPAAYKRALRDLIWSIPDGHLSAPIDNQEFADAIGGGLGMAIRELDDKRVIVNYLLDGGPAATAGIKLKAEIVSINGKLLYVWRAVRLIGVGPTRPVFLLADNSPGYQRGIGLMVMFTHATLSGPRPPPSYKVPFPPPGMVPPRDDIPDAGPSTFYPAMSNIDFEIGDGNPAAVAVRFHVAQHSFLTHMDFHLGSGLAGVYQAGNEAEDLHFYGGRYGILTEKTSPAWQFTVIDSTFEGQKNAAIREHEAGLTLVNVSLRDVPVGIEIDRGYGDSMFGKDVRFENVRQAAVVISNENNVFTQVGFANALACTL
jgi:hypothetical protein